MANIGKPTNVLYEGQVFQVVETSEFAKWLGSLRDLRAAAYQNCGLTMDRDTVSISFSATKRSLSCFVAAINGRNNPILPKPNGLEPR